MDTTRGQSVAQWLETADVSTLTEVIRDYGEERFAQQVAKAIDRRRQERGPFRTTRELAEVVAGAVKTREPGKDPATRTFQAFRIFINAELEELQQALEGQPARAAAQRSAGGDQFPFAGRPHGQAVHGQPFAHGGGPARAVCRAGSDGAGRRAACHAVGARGGGQSAFPQRGHAGGDTHSGGAACGRRPRGGGHDPAEPGPAAGGAGQRVLSGPHPVRITPPVHRAGPRPGAGPRLEVEHEQLQVPSGPRPRRRACSMLATRQLQMRPVNPAITHYVQLPAAAVAGQSAPAGARP
jgi:hypothetical protein